MFKVYIRTIVMYGIENFDLSTHELLELGRIESAAIKKMIGITNGCHVKELLRGLGVELTEKKYVIKKLSFVSRLLSNKFTKQLYDELEQLEIFGSLPLCINRILKPVSEAKHFIGTQFSKIEQIETIIRSLVIFGERETETSVSVKLIRKILSLENKKMIPYLLYFYLNSRGADEFCYNPKGDRYDVVIDTYRS
jgi:hypothetical protein